MNSDEYKRPNRKGGYVSPYEIWWVKPKGTANIIIIIINNGAAIVEATIVSAVWSPLLLLIQTDPPSRKKRLDEVCLEKFQQYSRNYIQSWIIQGKVIVDGKVVTKAGHQVSDKAVVEIKAEIPKYVCRAGHKLEAAIEQLGVDVTGKVALDSGLSTGGFTDCLLQHGASFVYGVDVGYGQVADKIRRDERVSVIERTNLRYLTELPQKVDLVTLDLSFISILVVMPAVVNLMKEEATLITLIKPQFEARRSQVGGGGIVRDPLVHQEVREKIVKGVKEVGFQCNGWIESPLKGAEGNIEFLACFTRTTVSSPVTTE
ncbi:hypothetical protein M8C21_013630 [Ambrosia artemisiifolia]|uniref:RNA-binding S4 domain-containing protein n=1 Tax=Ambrosia artemisiifolia TaxID=4212 RepID=A0AAD5D3Y9_AMBAR|nr:hypothetical protein M8C21_013630 [Ambrosia artemisiifolia]